MDERAWFRVRVGSDVVIERRSTYPEQGVYHVEPAMLLGRKNVRVVGLDARVSVGIVTEGGSLYGSTETITTRQRRRRLATT